ncbi:MAG: alpha/beta hydrolase, partial [Rhizobiaceae bacterium]|nr:alpha/beta hydrolase [Rhizobiaceae bacterium]
LEYACYGPAPDAARTIVMLHEGLGCTELWRTFPEELANATGYGVFVYSRAGYGRSDLAELPRPLDYMTREAVDVLPEILDQIGFQHGILLGHSDGATIAAIYTGSIEDHRIRALILMAPHFFTEPDGLAEIAKAKIAYDESDLKGRMAKYHNDPDNTFRGWNDAWLHPDFKDWNVAEVIDYLRIPVLAIQGKDDQYGSYAQIKEIDDRIYSPVDIVMLENCRHSPYIDQPENTLNAVTGFISQLDRIETEKVKVA